MMLAAKWVKYRLNFIRESRTSREVLNCKDTYYIKVTDCENGVSGYGEAALFRGLSADDTPDFEDILTECCKNIHNIDIAQIPSSAIRMGLETALADLKSEGVMEPFYPGIIPPTRINGLIWMGSKHFMLDEIERKLANGFHCLKLKIGGIDFSSELEILQSIRRRYGRDMLELRLDANGAFTPANALQRLETLSVFDIHSIEQPIKAGQIDAMAEICHKSPVPIALDEELIGITDDDDKLHLLNEIKPSYIILKPTMCGGFAESGKWISAAERNGVGWWTTSALESNIGLNAIARWTASHNVAMPQGLGTGQLYKNNIPSPLMLEGEYITSKSDNEWDLRLING